MAASTAVTAFYNETAASDPVYDPPIFGTALLFLTVTVGMFGNLLIIVTYLKSKALRSPANVFIINLAVSDMAVIFCVVPILHTMISNGGKQFYNDLGCFWHAAFVVTCCTTSLDTMGFIAITRYICIVHPQKKQTFLQYKWCILASFLIWVYAIVILIPALAGWGRLGWLPKQYHCSYDWNYNQIYNGIIFFFGYGLVSAIIFFCYFWIFRIVKASRSRVGGGSKKDAKAAKGQKDEIRLAIQLLVVYVIYNICWFPFLLFTCFVDPRAEMPVELYSFLLFSIFSNSAVNVMVYLYFNRVFRVECYKLVCCGKELKEKSNNESNSVSTTKTTA